MNVHIIGGSGFLGRRVIPRLVGAGHAVTGMARSDDARLLIEAAGARAITGDLDDAPSIARVLKESSADALITSVSLGMGHGPRIVAAAEEAGVGRGIFVSTTSIYTELDSPLKPVRIAAEEAIAASSIAWTIVRPTMIYGGIDDGNISRLLRLLRRTPLIPLPGGGKGLVQPVHVEDVADAIVSLLARDLRAAYELAGPDPIPLKELVRQAAAAMDRRVITVPVPLGAMLLVARLIERRSPTPVIRAEQVARLAEDKAFDISAARRDIGFEPRSFLRGIGPGAASTG